MTKEEAPIVVEQVFNQPIEKVWKAITELSEMKKWFFDNIESFKPVVGFETRFVVQNEGRIFPHLWKLTAVEPLKKITYDWRYEGYSGKALVMFELINIEAQTKLKLTHTVIEDFTDDIPEFKRESGVAGWNFFIKKSLHQYLSEN